MGCILSKRLWINIYIFIFTRPLSLMLFISIISVQCCLFSPYHCMSDYPVKKLLNTEQCLTRDHCSFGQNPCNCRACSCCNDNEII